MNRDDLGTLIAVSGEDIEAMPWEDDPTDAGVYRKTLWKSGPIVLGLMRVDEGSENPEHVHHAAHHHILILDGQCTIVGKRLGPGAYVYIPPTVPHGVTDVGPGGCTFFYTYRPMERVIAQSPLDDEHGGVV
ncbi:MAG TPA: cupin domain-containing protein [Actinomycetota bacterium]|nr:cupin domain-containing protein [Actinomycetota bacterium]